MDGISVEELEIFEMLNRYVGARILGENLGEDEEFVTRVSSGEQGLEAHHVDAMYDLMEVVQQAVGEDLGPEEPVVQVGQAPENLPVRVRPEERVAFGIDFDGDNEPDVVMGGMVSARPGVGWMDEQEKKRVSLRNARALAVMTMFRLGMKYEEQVAALGLVSQIELALIAYFRDSVPEPGQTWDSHRRAREIERRLARLRWVEHEQEKERRGVRGVWNWLVGKEQLSGKMLFDKMIEHADGMLAAMKLERGDDLISEALRFTGSDRMMSGDIVEGEVRRE